MEPGGLPAEKGVDERWTLEGVEVPHDLTLVAAPLRLAGQERPLAVLISETRASDSRLHKFILMPAGTPPPKPPPPPPEPTHPPVPKHAFMM